MTPMLAAVTGYLVLQFVIGIVVSRRIATEDDYLVAGRRLGPWLATASIFATWFGAETVVGSAGVAFVDGVSLAQAEPFGYALSIILMGAVFAIPLWRLRLTTLADLFRQRYSVAVERVAAVILIPSSLLWAAAQLRAFGQVIVITGTDVSLDTAITISATVVILYTVFGGLLADAITDLVQAVVLVASLVILGAIVVSQSGGVLAVGQYLAASEQLRVLPVIDASWWELAEEWSIPILGGLVAAEVVSRVIATRSSRVARGATIGAGMTYLIVGSIPIVLGLLAAPMLATAPSDAEQVIPMLAQQVLPGWLFIIFAGGLISAILSTVDSTLLVAGGIAAHNIALPLVAVPTDTMRVRVTRAFVALGGIIAWTLAREADGVYALIEVSSSLGSAGILVVTTFALFTPWGGARTAVVTLVGGVMAFAVATLSAAPTPFLISVVTALVLYLAGALLERRGPTG